MPELPKHSVVRPRWLFVHIDNLETLMRCDALHAPNHLPADRLPYRVCHDPEVHGAEWSFVRFARMTNWDMIWAKPGQRWMN
jgi:hypothetical protein